MASEEILIEIPLVHGNSPPGASVPTGEQNLPAAVSAYLPMTETAYYILLSLVEPRHGYGIMQHVSQLTDGRIKLGAGTLYGNAQKVKRNTASAAHTGEGGTDND